MTDYGEMEKAISRRYFIARVVNAIGTTVAVYASHRYNVSAESEMVKANESLEGKLKQSSDLVKRMEENEREFVRNKNKIYLDTSTEVHDSSIKAIARSREQWTETKSEHDKLTEEPVVRGYFDKQLFGALRTGLYGLIGMINHFILGGIKSREQDILYKGYSQGRFSVREEMLK